MKRAEKYLLSKKNFSSFLQISCSNFTLKLCQRPSIYQNSQKHKICLGLGRIRSKKTFSETIVHKIFETNSSFNVKEHNTGKVQVLLFRSFFLVLTKFSLISQNNSVMF